MKVIQVHNWHRVQGGMNVVVAATIELLRRKGIKVLCLTRNSGKLGLGFLGKLRAFACGLYSVSACQEMKEMIRYNSPDIVQVHEIFPFISPWILDVCRRWNIPVVMRCPNYRLICPTAHLMRNGATCDLCVGGREYWCVLKNCRDNVFESIAYALRNMVARKCQIYQKSVTLFITPAKFVKSRLVDAGIPEERIEVIPNMVPIPTYYANPSFGAYIAYVGRVHPEKGIDTLLAAANLTGLPLQVGGDYTAMPNVISEAPRNIRFLGFLDRGGVNKLYQHARFVVMPSISYEAFPNSVLEAMSHGLPVIASRIGGIPEIVDDGITGFLFDPGNYEELASKMKLLWENTGLCRQMGQAGRKKTIRKYNEEIYFKRLMHVYMKAIEINNAR